MSRWIDGEWLLNFFEPYPDDYQIPLGTLRACVDDAPTIEPKRSEWIEMYRNGFGNMICMCSKCNFHTTKSNFCPNCGADMRKGVGDETKMF